MIADASRYTAYLAIALKLYATIFSRTLLHRRVIWQCGCRVFQSVEVELAPANTNAHMQDLPTSARPHLLPRSLQRSGASIISPNVDSDSLSTNSPDDFPTLPRQRAW